MHCPADSGVQGGPRLLASAGGHAAGARSLRARACWRAVFAVPSVLLQPSRRTPLPEEES